MRRNSTQSSHLELSLPPPSPPIYCPPTRITTSLMSVFDSLEAHQYPRHGRCTCCLLFSSPHPLHPPSASQYLVHCCFLWSAVSELNSNTSNPSLAPVSYPIPTQPNPSPLLSRHSFTSSLAGGAPVPPGRASSRGRSIRWRRPRRCSKQSSRRKRATTGTSTTTRTATWSTRVKR